MSHNILNYPKSRIILTLIIAMLLACQPQNTEVESGNPEKKRQQVRETIDKLNAALVVRDKATMEMICSDGLSYGHSNGILQNKEAFIDDVLNGPFQFLRADIENQEIELFEDMAIVKYIFVAQGIREGDTVDLRLGTSSLFKFYRDGQCELVLRQGYKL